MKWTSKSLGSRLQHEIFYWLIRCHLVGFARILLHLVVFYYVLKPSVRQRCYPYVRRRFPQACAMQRIVHTYRLYLCFAQGLLEKTIAGILGKSTLTADQDARKVLANCIAGDTGCIVLTAHIGFWQMGLMDIENMDRPVNIVQWRISEDVDKHYFEHPEQQGKHKINVINSRDGIDASFQIIAALRRKEVICLAGDRIADVQAQSLVVDFLGGKISLPLTGFLLASLLQVPLVITFSILDGRAVRGIWAEKVTIPAGLRHEPQKFLPYVQHFASCMEMLTQKYPYHFFNFYDMWENHDTTRM
jgi:predicted LPLAT superfamily acyltransferase